MAKIGDEALFLGGRPARPPVARTTDQQALLNMQHIAQTDLRRNASIVSTGSPTLSRVHETRVEIDQNADDRDTDYIREDDRITDVVIASEKDAVEGLSAITALIGKLRDIHHVNAVRLRSLAFTYAPERYTRAVIDRLGNLNSLTVVNPLRLEIETRFLHSSEITPVHKALAGELRNRGITVYANTPLLAGINDTPDEVHEIAYRCRTAGIEFHHVYVAGLPMQESWAETHPVDLYDVIDIATRIRKDGSGREIPRYIILTRLGEVDYGLTSELSADEAGVRVKLLPFTLDYYTAMDETFTWPAHVDTDPDGAPVIVVTGLKKTTDFALC